MSNTTNVACNNSIKSEPSGKEQTNDLLKQVQTKADEILEISRNNVAKAIDRGQNISQLTEISKNLEEGAGKFAAQAETVQRKEWKKRIRRKIAIFSILAILLGFALLLTIPRLTQ